MIQVKRVESWIPRVCHDIKVGDELAGFRVAVQTDDDAMDEQALPVSAAAEDGDGAESGDYHTMPSPDELLLMRASGADGNCSLSSLMDSLLQHSTQYHNEDEDKKQMYEMQFFFLSKPQFKEEDRVNLSCRAVAVDSLMDSRLPNKTSLKVNDRIIIVIVTVITTAIVIAIICHPIS